VKKSPFFNVFYNHHAVQLTVDSGAETNMVREDVARCIGASITRSGQSALQADGRSPLEVIGEIHIKVSRGHFFFVLDALVVSSLDVDVLAGVPFMAINDIAVRPARHQIILDDNSTVCYGSESSSAGPHVIRRTQACVLRSPSIKTTLWPGEYVELDVPDRDLCDRQLALEPRTDSYSSRSMDGSQDWPQPKLVTSVGDKIRITNDTCEPQIIRRNEHFCEIRPVFVPEEEVGFLVNRTVLSPEKPAPTCIKNYHHKLINLDPQNILPPSVKAGFQELHVEFDEVFTPSFEGYNGASGPIKGVVNMGPVLPPQRKGRVPQYSRDKLQELQAKFDELESVGVFKRPEDVGEVAEYLNPSFLVKKPKGGFRLVTAFSDVGRYSKPQPSLMPDVDSTLRTIARWKFIAATDLTSSFYQIPLGQDSIKYCGVVTPFRGVRV
jgi:hypothetical protein